MYKICKKTVYFDGEFKTVYGIQSEKITIDDITTDFESLERLVMLLNKNDVSSEHIIDIIEDFIIAN